MLYYEALFGPYPRKTYWASFLGPKGNFSCNQFWLKNRIFIFNSVFLKLKHKIYIFSKNVLTENMYVDLI